MRERTGTRPKGHHTRDVTIQSCGSCDTAHDCQVKVETMNLERCFTHVSVLNAQRLSKSDTTLAAWETTRMPALFGAISGGRLLSGSPTHRTVQS